MCVLDSETSYGINWILQFSVFFFLIMYHMYTFFLMNIPKTVNSFITCSPEYYNLVFPSKIVSVRRSTCLNCTKLKTGPAREKKKDVQCRGPYTRFIIRSNCYVEILTQPSTPCHVVAADNGFKRLVVSNRHSPS